MKIFPSCQKLKQDLKNTSIRSQELWKPEARWLENVHDGEPIFLFLPASKKLLDGRDELLWDPYTFSKIPNNPERPLKLKPENILFMRVKETCCCIIQLWSWSFVSAIFRILFIVGSLIYTICKYTAATLWLFIYRTILSSTEPWHVRLCDTKLVPFLYLNPDNKQRFGP